jgi:hypothetical protein
MRSKRTKVLAAIVAVSFMAPAILIAISILKNPNPNAPSQGTREVVVFTGAPGWTGERKCVETKEPRCDSEWRHTETGQLVSVIVFDVKDPRAMSGFVDRLANDVTQKGGVVERFTQNGMQLVRFLQQLEVPGQPSAALINYALIPRNEDAVHLISSVVPFDEQRPADERLRALLEHASWTPR